MTVDKVAASAMAMGEGTLLAKIDVKSASQLVSIHQTDWQLLGVSWHGSVFVDTKLPFGLRSVPKIFNVLADNLEWCFRQNRAKEVEHYLDDFITMSPP